MALDNAIKLCDPQRDHLFIVTVRDKAFSDPLGGGDFDERSRVILSHKLWRAAAGIVSQAQQKAREAQLDYTSILPEAYDARELVCALVKKYKIDVLIIGKHKENEQRHRSRFFRSFQRYCQSNAKCSVMTF